MTLLQSERPQITSNPIFEQIDRLKPPAGGSRLPSCRSARSDWQGFDRGARGSNARGSNSTTMSGLSTDITSRWDSMLHVTNLRVNPILLEGHCCPRRAGVTTGQFGKILTEDWESFHRNYFKNNNNKQIKKLCVCAYLTRICYALRSLVLSAPHKTI